MEPITAHRTLPLADRIRRSYFPVASGLLLALTLIGFSDNLFTDIGQRSNADPKFIVHGSFCLAWMLLLFAQTALVRTRHVRLHRRLGMAGGFVAIGVTLATLWVFVAVWKGWDAMAPYVKANRVLLPSFALLVLLGIVNRKRADLHKRLLFVATLYMMEPVLSRALDPFLPLFPGFTEPQIDRAWWVFFLVTWNGLFLSLFAYDWIAARRIHPVTALGYLWFCAIFATVWFV